MTNPAPSLLIVDDEPRSLYALEMLLSPEGYRIAFADSGRAALTHIAATPPDVVLLDVMMPDMTGYTVCEILKQDERWRHIPIILITALDRKEDVVQGLDAGADEFLTKPVSGPELRARVRSMLRIKRQYDQIQDTLQLREELANMIVHDMRNPLSTLMLYIDVLLSRAGNGDPAQPAILETMRTQALYLSAFLGDMLLMAKMQEGRLVLDRQPVNMCALAEAARHDFIPLAQTKQIQIVCHVVGEERPLALDQKLVRRMVDNLLSNAVKFAPRQSTVELRLIYEATAWRLEVVDTGPGVPPAHRQRIFDRYEIVAAKASDLPQIGLGLALCKLVAEAHGGTIYVTDNQPQGAKFVVEM